METWGDSDGVVEAAETPWTFDQSGVSDFISLPVKPCSQSNTAAAAAAAVHGEEPSRTAGLAVPPTPRSAREEAKGWPLEKGRVLGPRWRSGLRFRQRSISTSHPSLCCLLASQKVSLCAGWFCSLGVSVLDGWGDALARGEEPTLEPLPPLASSWF